MGKYRLLEMDNNNIQNLTLGFFDSHCKSWSDMKLKSPELEGHINIRKTVRDMGNEYSIADMCPCNDSGFQDVPGE